MGRRGGGRATPSLNLDWVYRCLRTGNMFDQFIPYDRLAPITITCVMSQPGVHVRGSCIVHAHEPA
jgi:hypothetical protein